MNPAAIAVSLLIAAGFPLPSAAAAKTHCVDGSAEEARFLGSDVGPPTFTAAMFARPMTLDASADGLDESTLPISIEAVCGLPKALDKQAGALAGGDGIALITTKTSVWKDGVRLAPSSKLVELDGADTVTVRARLLRQASWKPDEDGDPIPTFRATRIVITD
ncbi:MAG TPA: hypothetical protein VH247_01415 [Thermoleophilaceae bacterium]|nr:hypothetical protein [Thermoleophilaceae bacterium]